MFLERFKSNQNGIDFESSSFIYRLNQAIKILNFWKTSIFNTPKDNYKHLEKQPWYFESHYLYLQFKFPPDVKASQCW